MSREIKVSALLEATALNDVTETKDGTVGDSTMSRSLELVEEMLKEDCAAEEEEGRFEIVLDNDTEEKFTAASPAAISEDDRSLTKELDAARDQLVWPCQ